MLIPVSAQIHEFSHGGTPKAILLRGGVLRNLTQVAVATLRETDVMGPHPMY